MLSFSSISVAFLALAFSAACAQKCPLQFDGRIPQSMSPSSFDQSPSPYNPSFVYGQNLEWSEIIKLPNISSSLFDFDDMTKALEVTITNASVFAPSATDIQTGFRRAELLPASNSGTDPSTSGLKTLHFSLMLDATRPLNLSHEYQLVFLETNDYSTNQFALKTGTITDYDGTVVPSHLVLQGNVEDNPVTTLFETNGTVGIWHNFGIVMDFDNNLTQVLYSSDSIPLQNATKSLPNDLSGQGQFHFGILKKPTGIGLTDITTQGYQEPNINEGVIFGGIFEEDSSSGCISLGPTMKPLEKAL